MNRTIAVVGFDGVELGDIETAAQRLGYTCTPQAWLGPQRSDIVLDIRASRHPVIGGRTGWQIVRHLAAGGSRVLAVTDPDQTGPDDLEDAAVVVAHECAPAEVEAALRLLFDSTAAAA